ncbi:hypothetical protein K493DRAFT_311136 [Basidiobolus meristosporus CBS 931.73]|uniref:Transmembrane protein n=1 Tax=Basidiobolus meristosporus CBS 931.73 TaxID=1314790 RepID=A0A1Y1Z3Y0_9FUNG|nr:hypothetical protein K493DRAFT_311136 [Basidiobolus meristosporus CBS 931.73]|eukprot:ORY04991.1 hypothetical protein K493DRAFT_311136 [Basidiobolus meristosporus CBS 931.73]
MSRITNAIVASLLFASTGLCQTAIGHPPISPTLRASIAIESPTNAPTLHDPIYDDSPRVPPSIIVAYVCSGVVFIGLMVALWYYRARKAAKSSERSRCLPYEEKGGDSVVTGPLGQKLAKFTPAALFRPKEVHGPRRTPSTTQLLQRSDSECTSVPQIRVEPSAKTKGVEGDLEFANTKSSGDFHQVW